MQLIHIKMKNGEDLLGYLVSSTDHHIEINTPIAVDIEPALGFFAKSWLMLSENNSVRLSKEDYMFWSNANKKATEYYDEFIHRLAEKPDNRSEAEFTNDLEEVFSALMESKASIKH
jgi:hypothetical protein